MELLSLRSLTIGIVGFLIYLIGGAWYRLYWSPIAKFPGSKLAALTLWYEFYYDVIKRGRYTYKIAEMHKKYGPIIRINPYEIHINDPEFIDDIYVGSSSRKTDKYPWAMVMFGNSSSVFSTTNHDLHRLRRAAVAPFLSTSSVQKLEPLVKSFANKAVLRLRDTRGSGAPTNLIDLYTALTSDIISQYAFGRPFNYLDRPGAAEEWHQMWMDVSETTHLVKQYPSILPVMENMPVWIVKLTKPVMLGILEIRRAMRDHVLEVKADLKEGREADQKTIFHDILTNENIRPEEKESSYLSDEAQTIIAAGTLTTAHALSVITFHLLDQPKILQRLQEELSTLSAPKWQQLEQLPYLSAIITEGLRLSYGVTHRLQRMFPDVVLQYKEWTIPTNTPVSMTPVLVHDNESIFPDHKKFNPERWLQPSSQRLQKYILTFGRGSRMCVGMNLARCEIYLTIAALFSPRDFRLKLHETDITDVETPHDFFNPCYRMDSKGIRVTVD